MSARWVDKVAIKESKIFSEEKLEKLCGIISRRERKIELSYRLAKGKLQSGEDCVSAKHR